VVVSRETKELSILQQLNMALAIGVIVAAGDAVQNLLIEDPPIADPVRLFDRLLLLAYILLWSAKLFVDDHYILGSAESKNAPWADFLLCIASYSSLISAAALIKDDRLSTIALTAHFVLLIVWLVTGFARKQPDASRAKKFGWLLVDLACLSILSLLLLLDPPAQVRVGSTLLLIVIGIVDARLSNTFSAEKLR
jgi:hypothetical protein